MTNYKTRRVVNTPLVSNNIVMKYSTYVYKPKYCITEDENYDEDSNLWGQFVDIESMSLFCQEPQRNCKKKNAITARHKNNEKYEEWYNESEGSSVCSSAEMFGKFILSIIYGFTSIKNQHMSTNIAKLPPV